MRRTIVLALIVFGSAAIPRAADGARPWPVVSLAEVRGDPALLARAGFDLTEHGHDGVYDVVLRPGDRERLDRLGISHRVLVEDMIDSQLETRRAEAAAQPVDPSRRLIYRTLADYEADMTRLAGANPNLVRIFEMPYRTHEGRAMKGIEIAGNITSAATDGRPTAAIDGLHHAREWPSGEVTMMLAEDLVSSYGRDPAITELLDAIRVIVIPVVNPDGFVRSRETVSDFVAPLPGGTAVASEFAYHRKNLRPTGPLQQGVDPNRNYPFLWGGPGASGSPSSQTYHGPGPASEPEIQNVISVLRSNHVVTFVTNHTYGNLILRPWGHTYDDTADEAQLRELGGRMAAHNGYRSQKGIQLYVTTGTTDDWLYAVSGGLGYTFEIGSGGFGLGNVGPTECAGFHPQYNLCIPDYYAKNRGAFLELLQAARDTSMHSVLTGTAPPGTTLTLTKTARVPLDQGEMTETLRSQITVGAGGIYEWHVNPSPLPLTVMAGGTLESYVLRADFSGGGFTTREVLALRGQLLRIDLAP